MTGAVGASSLQLQREEARGPHLEREDVCQHCRGRLVGRISLEKGAAVLLRGAVQASRQ